MNHRCAPNAARAARDSSSNASAVRGLLSVSVLAALATSGLVRASVPIFAGPGGPAGPTGIQSPTSGLTKMSINNQGVALAEAASYLNGNSTGTHGYRWDPTSSTVSRFAGLSNIVYPTKASSINSAGVVVGYATTGANLDVAPVIYAPNSLTPNQISSPAYNSTGHSNAFAYLINDKNMFAGYELAFAGSKDLGTRSVRWDAGNVGLTELGVINTDVNGATQSFAHSMNANGTVVGTALRWNAAGTTNLGARGVRWAGGSSIAFELDTPFTRNDGFADVDVRDVNLTGATVGTCVKWAGNNSQGTRPVRWAAGGTAATVLDVFGGDVNGVASADAGQINDAGVTIGNVQKFSAANVSLGFRGVRWNAGTTACIELAGLPGQSAQPFQGTGAYDINAMGTISGDAASGPTGITHATIWPGADGGAVALDLNSLLPSKTNWVLVRAWNVSDTGFVVGDAAFDPDGTGPAAAYAKSYSMLVPQAGTYGLGDADFNTTVDFADLLVLAKNYGKPSNSSVLVADFDLNGTTDFVDLLTLAKHYGTPAAAVEAATGDAAFASDWALAQSLVPEPSAAGIVALAAASALLRRRGVIGA